MLLLFRQKSRAAACPILSFDLCTNISIPRSHRRLKLLHIGCIAVRPLDSSNGRPLRHATSFAHDLLLLGATTNGKEYWIKKELLPHALSTNQIAVRHSFIRSRSRRNVPKVDGSDRIGRTFSLPRGRYRRRREGGGGHLSEWRWDPG